jgi:hypothetical protein
MTSAPDVQALLQQGLAAARVGERAEAESLLRQVTRLAPDNIDAWLALSGVVDDLAEKEACFQAVLRHQPENPEARLGLEWVRRKRAELQPEDETGHELEMVLTQASRQLEEAIGPAPPDVTPPDDEVLFCANHPNVETALRCNRCGKPICTRCMVRTPVGYRCRECVGQQQAIFFSGGPTDYVIGGVVSLVLGLMAGLLMGALGNWLFSLILGPLFGGAIAEVVRVAVRRRRSRYLWLVTAGGIVVGALPVLFGRLVLVSGLPGGLGFVPALGANLLALGIYLFLAVGAAVARLR